MLKHGPTANFAKRHFFKYRNTINIFTEDNPGDTEFYKVLFYRLFEGTAIIINDVQPIGCKDQVIKAHDSCTKSELRDSIFIIDGDLDLITATNRESSNTLFVLDSYCIENYLFEEKGILDLLHTIKGDTSMKDLKKLLNFSEIHNEFPYLNLLFIYFAILKELNGGPEIKFLEYFCDKKFSNYDVGKVTSYYGIILNEIKRLNPNYNARLSELTTLWNINSIDTFIRIISGKDFLFKIIRFKIKQITKKTPPENSFMKMYLAKNINIDRFDSLKNIILSK